MLMDITAFRQISHQYLEVTNQELGNLGYNAAFSRELSQDNNTEIGKTANEFIFKNV